MDSEADEREMWDALILDSPTEAELELLEIRLNELHEVVDKVFIIESNSKQIHPVITPSSLIIFTPLHSFLFVTNSNTLPPYFFLNFQIYIYLHPV